MVILAGLGLAYASLVVFGTFGLKINVRSKTSEAKWNLQSLAKAEQDFHDEKQRYSRFTDELWFQPERGNRYTYFLARTGEHEKRTGTTTPFHDQPPYVFTAIETDLWKYVDNHWSPPTPEESGCPITTGRASNGDVIDLGVVESGPGAGFLMLAAAQLGPARKPMDCWTVASVSRVGKDGTTIPAGEPYHEQDGQTAKKPWWKW